jgi:hypothetical protein
MKGASKAPEKSAKYSPGGSIGPGDILLQEALLPKEGDSAARLRYSPNADPWQS